MTPERFRNELQRSHLVVVPSRYESFSLTGLEALACGVPLIITRESGLSEYLNDGEGCFLVDYGDVDGLAGRIDELLRNGRLWKNMAKDARKLARQFSWRKAAGDHVRCYRLLTSSHHNE